MGKVNVTEGKLCPLLVLDERTLAALSARELKEICALKEISVHSFVEKKEFINALSVVMARSPAPRRLAGKWRASYVYAERDAKRKNLTRKELASIDWVFFFRQNPREFASQCQFSAEGRFTMTQW
jgi:hypothetical protein